MKTTWRRSPSSAQKNGHCMKTGQLDLLAPRAIDHLQTSQRGRRHERDISYTHSSVQSSATCCSHSSSVACLLYAFRYLGDSCRLTVQNMTSHQTVAINVHDLKHSTTITATNTLDNPLKCVSEPLRRTSDSSSFFPSDT